MEILNLSSGGGYSPKKSNKFRAVIGVGFIAASIGIGSTLAANIGINAGPVEFGQGVAQTVACSGEESIIVTPSSTFSNEGADIETVYTDHDSGRYSGSGWLEVPSTAGITVGMVVNDGEGPVAEDTVVVEIEGDRNVYISKITSNASVPSGGFPVTFSESRGTPATLTPNYGETTTPNDHGGFSISSSTLAIGMLVTGPGISADTVVTWVGQDYVQVSKTTTYSSGDLTFTNSRSGIQGSFKLSEITVSNIPDTCNDKVFTIKIYDNTNPEPLKISNWAEGDDTSVQVWWANGVRRTEESFAMVNFPNSNHAYYNWNDSAYNNGYAIETNGYSSMPAGAFKVNLPTSVNASRVYKITVESMDDSPSINVGGTGQSFYGYWY